MSSQTERQSKQERMKAWRQANAEHIRSYQKQWRDKNAEAIKAYQSEYHKEYRTREGTQKSYWKRNLRDNYNLTPDCFNAMWSKQDGKCAVCEISMEPRGRTNSSVAVDHNHHTGEVRGLLCRACNHGMGHMKDDPEVLLKAAEYLFERGYAGLANTLKGNK